MRLSETSVTRRNVVAVKAAVLEAACGGDDVLDFSGVTAVDSTSVSMIRMFPTSGKPSCSGAATAAIIRTVQNTECCV